VLECQTSTHHQKPKPSLKTGSRDVLMKSNRNLRLSGKWFLMVIKSAAFSAWCLVLWLLEQMQVFKKDDGDKK
jgi:hypothetical protein